MSATRQGRRQGLLSALFCAALLVLAQRGLSFLTVARSEFPALRASSASARFVAGGAAGSRQPNVARGDGDVLDSPIVAPTLAAIFAGLGVGVALAKAVEIAGTASQERGNVSESLKAQLSADAGMEDVEDDESDERKALIESMKKAQGITEDEVKKLKKAKIEDDDGW
mmetsp:Transcript_5714/g.10216  ORF Transcript_5714/g.10216 Transcript_5714/m.10216 type:complete len:169 (-) Transcript_5714:196-702(-)